MRRSEDIARELVEGGQLDPVTEAALTTPLSRRALLLSPIAAGLGLALGPVAAPVAAQAQTFDDWVQVERVEVASLCWDTTYYKLAKEPNSDGTLGFWIRYTMTTGRDTAYGLHWTSWMRVLDNGNEIGQFWPPKGCHAYDGYYPEQPGYNYANGPNGYAAYDQRYSVSGAGTHHIELAHGGYYCDHTIGAAGLSFYIDVPYTGKITVKLNPIFGTSLPVGGYSLISSKADEAQHLCYGTQQSYGQEQNDDVMTWTTSEGGMWGSRWFLTPSGYGDWVVLAPQGNHGVALDTHTANRKTCVWGRSSGDDAFQQWRFDRVGDYWRVTPKRETSMALTFNGANSICSIEAYTGRDAQLWRVTPWEPDESGTWRRVAERPSKAPCDVSGCVMGLYSDEACRSEVSRVTVSGSSSGAWAVFDKSVSSAQGTFFAKMITAPAHMRLDGGRHAIKIMSNNYVRLAPQYKRYRLWLKSVDEDGTVRTARLVTQAWPHEWVRFSDRTQGLEVAAVPSAETMGDLGAVDGSGATMSPDLLRGWLEGNPRAGGSSKPSAASLEMTSDVTRWAVLPDTVTFVLVRAGGAKQTVSTLRLRDASSISSADLRARRDTEGLLISSAAPGAERVLSDISALGVDPDTVERFFEDASCSSRVDWLGVKPRTTAYMRVRARKVTYVVDGSVMATDEVEVSHSWQVPAERTAQAARAGCTPGFSGWFPSAADAGVTSDEPAGEPVSTVDVWDEDVTLYGVNRATVSFGIDPASSANVEAGTVRMGPDAADAEATAEQRGLCPAIVRRVARSASLPRLSRLYVESANGVAVAANPRAWHAAGGTADSASWVVSADVGLLARWDVGTTDGVAARR